MKKSYHPMIILIALTVISCNSNKKAHDVKGNGAGIRLENLDTTVNAGNDFYQYACGGWMKKNLLTGEYARYSSFEKLTENNRKQIKTLIEEIAKNQNTAGSISQKIGDLYNMGMDSAKLNADGISPLKPELDKLKAIKDKSQFSTIIPEMMLHGYKPFFYFTVEPDAKKSSQNILSVNQGGISMGERDYYLDKDENTVNIRKAYIAHIAKMFEFCGFTPAQAKQNAEDVMRIETQLATVHYDKVKLRDPYSVYHKMTIDEVQKLTPNINWKTMLGVLKINVNNICVAQPEVLNTIDKIIVEAPIKEIIAYLQWKTIDNAATYLNDELYVENFDFYGKTMSGKINPKPRWKRAQEIVNSCLGEAVGQLYVEKYFPPEAKERMVTLVKNLQIAYSQRIKNLDWMSDSTKKKAIEKLNAFYIKIGYPDKWRDYSSLIIKNDSYYANFERASEFEMHYILDRAGKSVDRDLWYMTPQTVNAYYNPTTNEICFPAGILQYPFFDMNADDAFNYGAIGVVIGHEMTHGFDDEGRQFDKNGNLKDWWTEEDAAKFKERAMVMSDFFNNIEVAPGVHANGEFTLGETLADYGGLQISYQAYKNATANNPLTKKEGFTADQRFFLAFAAVWANNIREKEILHRTKTDPHALGKWRVNGEVPHIDAWYNAFNINENDKMFIPKDKRVTIW